VIVSTTKGSVVGASDRQVVRFLGIPYAEAPVGERRFAPPVARQPWSDTFDATRVGPRPPQPAMETPFGASDDLGPMDEDCLRVNVYTPGIDGGRPVMVWFHGGGLAFGTANEYDGTNLARQDDVVVVTVGYRLGLLGFADLSPCGDAFAGSASNGFRDQIAALEWVRDEIASFGGDPANVTVFGQSGAGVSILALLGAPAAEGLFHRAIVLSAGPPQPEPPEVVSILAGTLDVLPEDLPSALRELPVERILEIQQGIGYTAGGSVDGTVVTRFPVDAILDRGAAGVPIVIGTTRDEGTLLTSMMAGLRPAILRIIAEGLASGTFEGGDPAAYLERLGAVVDDDLALHTKVWTDHFRRTALRVATAACEAGVGGWLYRFDVEPTGELADELGVTHAADLGFVFDTLRPTDGPSLYEVDRPALRDTARRWSSTLASFARHGHLQAGAPEWTPFLPDRACLLVAEGGRRVAVDVDAADEAIWGDRSGDPPG
jgi:para-nitrobenzyl esterase